MFDFYFYLTAVPAVMLFGISKGGFAGPIAILAFHLMSMSISPIIAAGIMLPILIVMDITDVVELVNQYGIPVVVAVGMGYFIFYIWKFVTNNILPSLDKALGTLIGLIDRVRMLDNDMIRLDQKIHTIIEIQESKKQTEKDDV